MTNPSTAEACRKAAASRVQLGHHNAAEKALRSAVAWDPLEPQSRLDLAFRADQTGDTRRAIEEYAAALRVSPGHHLALFNLGVLFHRLERYQDADHLVQVSLEVVQQVLGERHPAAAHILVDRSVLRSALGDANGAGEALVAAVALMEASPEVFPEAYVRKHRAKLK